MKWITLWLGMPFAPDPAAAPVLEPVEAVAAVTLPPTRAAARRLVFTVVRAPLELSRRFELR